MFRAPRQKHLDSISYGSGIIEPAVPRSDLFAKCIGQTGEPSASFCFSEHYDEQTIKFFLTEVFYGLGSHESACERRGVNAGVKIPRFAGEKIHQCCWQEGPELGAFS
jgi:hypothetical protein